MHIVDIRKIVKLSNVGSKGKDKNITLKVLERGCE
jgi:hypothetical protein